MKYLFSDVALLGHPAEKRFYLGVTDRQISYIGEEKPADFSPDREIPGRGRLLTPAFYNAHTHAAMSLFRGYGEDLPLAEWLHDRILPAEKHLTEKSVYLGALLSAAEMIRNGIVSFSDMYFFCDSTVRAVAESGMKANIARSITTADPEEDFRQNQDFIESVAVFRAYNGAEDGRIKIDFSLHAEYSNVPSAVKYIAKIAEEYGAGVQIHLSETQKENEACWRRYGMTPTRFFAENGLFFVPVTAAHCVYLSDEDRAVLREYGVVAVHNPVSNLKLGSGVMPLRKMLDSGVTVALGTDGVASNNRQDILREMQLAALLQKGISGDPASVTAEEIFRLATENGAVSQRRPDCGRIAVGKAADILLWDTQALHNTPIYDYYTMLSGSASASDVTLTMADGRILYEDGAYRTVDVEKLRADFLAMHRSYFR